MKRANLNWPDTGVPRPLMVQMLGRVRPYPCAPIRFDMPLRTPGIPYGTAMPAITTTDRLELHQERGGFDFRLHSFSLS